MTDGSMARTLLAIYPHSARRYDEMMSADGAVRPHWQQFFSHLDAVAPDEMRQRLAFVDRRILENGVTTTSTPHRTAPTGRGRSTPCR